TKFFPMMGAGIALGRDFEEADGKPQPAPPPGAQPTSPAPRLPAVAILSYGYWQRRFCGRTDILGKPIPGAIQGNNIIAGVLAPGFELLFPADTNTEREPEVWFANRIPYDNANRNTVSLRVIGRLRSGTTMEQARAAADQVAANIRQVNVISNTAGYAIRLEPMHRHVVEEARPALLTLMGAVIFLLLIPCAHVGNLL